MRACSVWACNLCGTAGTWSVHLASVQRAAHRIMMTVAAASVFWGHERGRDSREKERRWGEKWRKKRVESTREQASYELGGVGCRKKRNKRGKGQRSFVFVLDYFCWVASVCSSCGQWIIQKKNKTSWVCLSASLSSLSRSGEDCKLFGCLREQSHPPAVAPCDSAAEDRHAAATVSRLGLSWQQSCCYTLPAPCEALIHRSVLQYDNPAHMAWLHTW